MVWNGVDAGELPRWDERKCPGMRCEGQPWGSSLQLQFYLCKCFTLILPLTLGKGTYKERKCPRMRCEGQLGGSSLLLLLRFLRTFLLWDERKWSTVSWDEVWRTAEGGAQGLHGDLTTPLTLPCAFILQFFLPQHCTAGLIHLVPVSADPWVKSINSDASSICVEGYYVEEPIVWILFLVWILFIEWQYKCLQMSWAVLMGNNWKRK